MKVPFLDLSVQYYELQKDIDTAMREASESGWYILGKRCENFEREFKAYLVREQEGYVVGCNSGTDALVLALRAAGIGPGDEVITVANTAIPTITAICSIGAVPVFCEIAEDTWLMDPDHILPLISSKTKAVLPVHLYGNVAQMTEIGRVAKEHGLKVIEDVAQACGARWDGHQAGTVGDFGAFSFYPSKNLGAMGDGGAVFCRSQKDYETLVMLRNYGQKDRYNASLAMGINSRLDEIQAAVLSVKLKYMDKWNKRKGEVVEKYRNLLQRTRAPLLLQEIYDAAEPAWHLMAVRLAAGAGLSRSEFIEFMDSRGIQVLIHYPYPAYRQAAFKEYFRSELPETRAHCESVVSFPLGHYLKDEAIEVVCSSTTESLCR
ncbi:DegT/DnrJ/EryC1/StrS family aminotransferase [Fibrobacterota bacterium]